LNKWSIFFVTHMMNLQELVFRSNYDQNSNTQMAFISYG